MLGSSRELEALIEPTLVHMGYELWGCELHGRGRRPLLRIYIDIPGDRSDGITLDDCERASRQLSGLLDVEDPLRGPYTLEVSSPGLDRPLLRPGHFERCAGQEVRIRLKRPVDGRRNFSGILRGLEDERVVVQEEEVRQTLPLRDIEQARLVPKL